MTPSIEEIKKLITPWNLIELSCKGPVSFNKETGYAGARFEETFEFR